MKEVKLQFHRVGEGEKPEEGRKIIAVNPSEKHYAIGKYYSEYSFEGVRIEGWNEDIIESFPYSCFTHWAYANEIEKL